MAAGEQRRSGVTAAAPPPPNEKSRPLLLLLGVASPPWIVVLNQLCLSSIIFCATQWVLSRLKGSIYPVYIGYIHKPTDFWFPIRPAGLVLYTINLNYLLWLSRLFEIIYSGLISSYLTIISSQAVLSSKKGQTARSSSSSSSKKVAAKLRLLLATGNKGVKSLKEHAAAGAFSSCFFQPAVFNCWFSQSTRFKLKAAPRFSVYCKGPWNDSW